MIDAGLTYHHRRPWLLWYIAFILTLELLVTAVK